jgi:hypothetical protein
MKHLLTAILGLSLLFSPVTFTGCVGPQTKEAVTYFTLRDAWTGAYQSYKAFAKLVVQGKVSKTAEARADKAWNDFRASYRLAVVVAKGNEGAPADEYILSLQSDFINLINQLSK